MSWLALVARATLGGVWVAAGLLKLPDPTENVRAVRAYQLLPEALVPVIGHGLPVLELVVGVCLLMGLVVRPMALLSGVMLVAFIVGISAAWARGLSIECGCFGGGGGPSVGASDKYPWELARDAGLLLASGLLVVRPRTPFALDDRLFPALEPAAER
ncbi:MAG TPA: MauE/DoxX family redox-associated membrane protein [Nocardioidaceae bacterium]|nr:MauE/DoxX family redox-associated membrane protein [Nocardioidaceae bacterium]